MSIFGTLKRHLTGDFDAVEIDHAPVELSDAHVYAYRHQCKLRRAAARNPRGIFKCAAVDMPREIRNQHGGYDAIKPGVQTVEPPTPPASKRPTLKVAR